MAQRNRLDLIKTYTSTSEYLMPFIKVSSLDQRQRFNITIEAEKIYNNDKLQRDECLFICSAR